MQQYCGCYSLLLHYMPKNVLFVTYSRSISQPHTRLTEMTLGRQVDIAVLQFTASYEADRLSFRCWLSYYSFNSQPHTRLTTAAPNNVPLKRPFNSQPHTRLTTCPSKKAKILNLSIHSLIRGWPCLHHRLSDTAKPFNSQPHTRLTTLAHIQSALLLIFQFTASYEADLIEKDGKNYVITFQFTASYEADLFLLLLVLLL